MIRHIDMLPPGTQFKLHPPKHNSSRFSFRGPSGHWFNFAGVCTVEAQREQCTVISDDSGSCCTMSRNILIRVHL